MSLKEYIRKRDFKKTAEPGGRREVSGKQRFVIQKHAASHLHYDFRLELAGTLKSWAVPKGVPYKKGEKRLAMQVEDHPVAYIDFEGIIPKGQYGGGTVMVWDQGTYEALSDSPGKELASGKLHFVLSGKKLKGEWYLVRMRDERQWLLIKANQDQKPVSARLDDTSALSGKSMKQLAGSDQVWHSNRSQTKPVKTTPFKKKRVAGPTLTFIKPMKARMVAAPPPGEWLYEVKFDGYRAIAIKQGANVQLLSRNEKDFGPKFPEVVEAVAEIKADAAIMDGEIVALDAKGRSSFQLLQSYDLGDKRPPIFFYAFDLLQLNGEDLRNEPLPERKLKLEKLIGPRPGIIRYSASLTGSISKLLKQAERLGLEGLIGKQKDSVYEAGRRSGAWIKLKLHREQEMVIGGYTDPGGARSHFGALLVGFQDHHKLRFAGKVGTGFNESLLGSLHNRLKQIARDRCPFSNLPEKRTARYGQAITATEMKRCHWVEPTLVGQIKFAEWTRDGKLRQPVFLGLREDKDASEVVRETPG